MSDERLSKLEEALAFQDQKLDELNEVITAQWREIDFLKRKLIKAEFKIEELELAGDGDAPVADQKPPHY